MCHCKMYICTVVDGEGQICRGTRITDEMIRACIDNQAVISASAFEHRRKGERPSKSNSVIGGLTIYLNPLNLREID